LLITTHNSCLQKVSHQLQNELLKNGPRELADHNMGLSITISHSPLPTYRGQNPNSLSYKPLSQNTTSITQRAQNVNSLNYHLENSKGHIT
jgi:hypothetical protein